METAAVLLKLLLLFIVLPLVELTLLLYLAEHVGGATTLAIVIVTGVTGTWLARSQGLRTFARIRSELTSSRMPTDSLVDAAMILVAGALLVTPGMITDLFGLSLLVPLCRRYYRRRLKEWFQSRFQVTSYVSQSASRHAGSSKVIDSYVVGRDE